MKSNKLVFPLLVAIVCACAVLTTVSQDVTPIATPHKEYITLCWDGRDNTHVIYGDGKVEFLKEQFASVKKPRDTDERAFYMTLALNALVKEGYEFVARTGEEITLRR
jgi:hypothetical protein